jgi:hypothetical protein
MKEEIIKKIESLKIKVKSPGKTYSQAQREEMRKEIAMLKIQLDEIVHQEDIKYINEFLTKHPKYYIPEKEELIRNFDNLEKEIIDENLKFALKFKISSFKSEVKNLASYENKINELQEALEYLSKNEKIPFSNSNYNKELREIQKYLAVYFRAIVAIYNKLILSLSEIQIVADFFNNDNNLAGFTYLSKAIFTEATNFEEGIAIAHQGSKKMYFAHNGLAYKIESEKDALPNIKKNRINPDLFPFEIEIDYFNKLMGYKNSNGEIKIPARYTNAFPFVNGFAKIGIIKDKHILYGIIDESGKIVAPCIFPVLDDVINDIVVYKLHKSQEEYERTSSFNFNMINQVKHLGQFSGYLIFGEIKPALIKEIDEVKQNDNKTIEVIDYYLRLVTNN